MPKPKRASTPLRFDPESLDSKLSEINTKLEGHFIDDTTRFSEQKGLLTQILTEVKDTNGRVTSLETFKAINDASRRNRRWIIGIGLTSIGSWATLILKFLHIF